MDLCGQFAAELSRKPEQVVVLRHGKYTVRVDRALAVGDSIELGRRAALIVHDEECSDYAIEHLDGWYERQPDACDDNASD